MSDEYVFEVSMLLRAPMHSSFSTGMKESSQLGVVSRLFITDNSDS